MPVSAQSLTTDDRILWGVMALALVLRLVALVFLSPDGLTDSETYFQAAQDILAGRVFTSELVMPLYPLQAALMGANPLALKLSDIAISTITVWLVHRLALAMLQDRGAALVAAVFIAIYPHFIFYSVSSLTETSYLALTVLGFWLLYSGRLLWGGLVLILGLLSRPSLELLLPILVLWFAVAVHRFSWPKAAGVLARLVLLYGLVMTPWWVHNEIKYGSFVRLSLGDGRMLYMGNDPLNQTGGGLEGVDTDVSRFYGLYEDPVERNDAMKHEALRNIQDDPQRFVAMAGQKFLRFWRFYPHADAYSGLMVKLVSLASYGMVFVLCVGFILREGFARWRMLGPVILLAGYLTAVHMATLASLRYRLPIEPFMIVLSCGGIRVLARVSGLESRLPDVLRASGTMALAEKDG